MDFKTYDALGLNHTVADEPEPWAVVINGRSNREIVQSASAPGDRQYNPSPEAFPPADTPRGTVASHPAWAGARVFPGTIRDLWIYTPSGFDPAGSPPALIVFQDGAGYLNREGPVRAAAVLDTLIAAKEAPTTVAVFIQPGHQEGVEPGPGRNRQRSIEYDSVSDAYARFVTEDLEPFVAAEIGCKLTTDPAWRTICGISSGGICAFTAAWFMPDKFARVISHCGSFTAIRGGHNYPTLIRKTERKPIRVWLQSGAADADIIHGSWPLANKEMAAALAFAGYDHQFVFGEGGHSLRHAGALFPDTLRWLWRVE